ncbi:protease PrsW [Pseudonocardiaceae bacterium YIM PH 21723]|nr:protease PrsW [Pseudonocardiaceae bacterium YIM PH 21723]
MNEPATMQIITARRGRTFYQPRRAMFWVYLILLVITFSTFGVRIIGQAIAMPGALLVGLIAQVILGYVLYRVIRWLDLFEKEPFTLLLAAFGWGAMIAPGLAVIANGDLSELVTKLGGTSFASRWTAALAGPTSEEWLKTLGVIAIVVIGRAHIQRAMDGLIYGAVVGLGFQLMENMTYAFNYAQLDPSSDTSGAFLVTFTRFMVGIGSHAVYTGVTGFGLGWAVSRTDLPRARRIAMVAGCMLVAWGLHFLWNSQVLADLGLAALLAKQAFVIAFFIVVYRISARYEFDWFRYAICTEPPEVISPSEVEELRTRRTRHQAMKRIERLAGQEGARLQRQLQEEQLLLAVIRDESPNPDGDLSVADARRAVLDTRARLRERLL